jgi:hypothetical protein
MAEVVPVHCCADVPPDQPAPEGLRPVTGCDLRLGQSLDLVQRDRSTASAPSTRCSRRHAARAGFRTGCIAALYRQAACRSVDGTGALHAQDPWLQAHNLHFVVSYKRLDRGHFKIHFPEGHDRAEIDSIQLTMLLDGIDFARVRRPPHWTPDT